MHNINKVFNKNKDTNINKAFILMILKWVRRLDLIRGALIKLMVKLQMNKNFNNGKKKWNALLMEIRLTQTKTMYLETISTLQVGLIPSISDKILSKVVVAVLPWILHL